MKFAHKLTIAMLLLLAASLSIGGYLMIQQDFDARMEQARTTNALSHMRELRRLESAFWQSEKQGINYERLQQLNQEGTVVVPPVQSYFATASSYKTSGNDSFAVYWVPENAGAAAMFCNLPVEIGRTRQLAVVASGADTVEYCSVGETHYMLMASPIETAADHWLISCYDITDLFVTRNTQLNTFMTLEVFVFVVASGAAYLLATLLTRPLRKLEVASRAIAEGAYDKRTKLKRRDEIGDLSRSFDQMAGSVEDTINQLNLAVEQREFFISAFTHEIKTPMTAILGYSDLLRSGRHSEQEQQLAANYIFHESKRLEVLSQKLMLLLGVTQGETLQLAFVPLQQIYTITNRGLPEMDITVDFVLPRGVLVKADPDLLADLLRNLILNAIKAEPKDNHVLVEAIFANGMAQICVADTGIGIAPEHLPHLTQPFYMVDKSRARAQNGSGMGLALANEIALAHGTQLHFESEVGVGTSVRFALPAQKEDTL